MLGRLRMEPNMLRKILKFIYRVVTGTYFKVFYYLKNRALRKYYIHKTEKYLVKVMTKLPKNVYYVKKSDVVKRKLGTWKIEKLSRAEFEESFSSLLK
jgi:hypothetical protein